MNSALPDYTDLIESQVEDGHVLIPFTPRTSSAMVDERQRQYEAKGFRVTMHFEQLRRNA